MNFFHNENNDYVDFFWSYYTINEEKKQSIPPAAAHSISEAAKAAA